MDAAFERRLLVAWLVLSALSLLSWWLGSSNAQAAPGADAAISVSVITMALIKARVIIREFMEVRRAPALLRHLTDAWLSLTAVTLLGTYLAGMAA